MSKAGSRDRQVLSLLGGQFAFFGIAIAYLYVTANTLFLVDFGSEWLPYVYIAVGVFVSLTFYGMAELQRRWPMSRIIIVTNSTMVVIYFLARFLLTLPDSAWVSFTLLTFFFFGVQLFFVSAGGQAGRLFDVRQMKRFFPLLVATVNIAFIIANLSVSSLLPFVGCVENLLLISGGAMLITLIFAWLTVERFRPQFTESPQSGERKESRPKSLFQLLRKRYVFSIFSYQFLSAIGTQLALFMLITLADARYTSPDELARFFGNFGAGRNTVNVLFMVLVAGRLMSRFGLSFGLAANPIGVGVMVVIMAIVSVIAGQSGILFWLTVATVSLDVIFSESITSTSLKAIYQSVPAAERSVVETGVEGIGVPLAFGVTGILLVLFNLISGLTFEHIIFFTVFVTFLWTAGGFMVFRGYAGALLKTLNRRALGDVSLSLDDESSLKAVESLVQSSKLLDVRLALDMLAEAEHESLDRYLIDLVGHAEIEVRAEALTRIEKRKVEKALSAITFCLQSEGNSTIKGIALRALCALKEEDAVEEVSAHLNNPEEEIRLGAMTGLLSYGGIPGVLAAGKQLTDMEHSANPADRAFAARVIGKVGLRNFYQPLLSLMADDDFTVRRAALIAAKRVNHPRQLPLIIDNLKHLSLRTAAMAALVGSGDNILPIAAKALVGETEYEEENVIRMVRACGDIRGRNVIALLRQHLNHPDDDTQYQVLVALDRCQWRVNSDDISEIEHTLKGEVKHGLRTLLAKQDIGEDESLSHLRRALDYEFEQARKRVFLLLSFIYDSRAILRAEDQLTRGSSRDKAMAMETLDVTLTGRQKSLFFALVNQSTPLEQRVRLSAFTLGNLSRSQRLNEIIADPEKVWTHGWSRASAIYAAAELEIKESIDTIEEALSITEHPIRETAAWALYNLAPDRYRTHAAELAEDANPQVAQLAAHLAANIQKENRRTNLMLLTLETVAVLKTADIFSKTPDYVLASVAAIVEEVDLDAGTTFIHKDTLEDDMYIIVEGEVRVHDGDKTIAILGQGEVVGEMELLSPAPRLVSASANTEIRLFRIRKDAFDEVMADRYEIAQSVIQVLVKRLRATTI